MSQRIFAGPFLGMALAALVAHAAPGCHSSSVSCERLSQRNATCADAFVAYAEDKARERIDEQIAALPPAARADAEKQLEMRFKKSAVEVKKTLTSNEFLDDCKASWTDTKKMPSALKKELQRCIDLPDCDGYAACFMEAEQSSKRDAG